MFYSSGFIFSYYLGIIYTLVPLSEIIILCGIYKSNKTLVMAPVTKDKLQEISAKSSLISLGVTINAFTG